MGKAEDKLKLAKRHLERVQAAWDTPTDWDDLSLYGFYCLEAAVYGDVPAPDMHAEDVASEIELYVDAVAELLAREA